MARATKWFVSVSAAVRKRAAIALIYTDYRRSIVLLCCVIQCGECFTSRTTCEVPMHGPCQKMQNCEILAENFKPCPSRHTHPHHNPIDMATIQLTATLPSLPDTWSAEKDFKPLSHLSAPTSRAIEPIGPHFLAHARRKRHKRTFSEDERIQAQQTVKKAEDDDPGDISEAEDPMLLQREAKDWKTQDHYAVLGLSRYRYHATEDQIKRAHRKKVLKHHPDKKAASGREEGDQFFKCIQRATEILLDPAKRRGV